MNLIIPDFPLQNFGQPLNRVLMGNFEYRMFLRCRHAAKLRFIKLRSDVLVKLQLLDNKRGERIVDSCPCLYYQESIERANALYWMCAESLTIWRPLISKASPNEYTEGCGDYWHSKRMTLHVHVHSIHGIESIQYSLLSVAVLFHGGWGAVWDSLNRQVASWRMGVGDHRVDWWWKGSWTNKIATYM